MKLNIIKLSFLFLTISVLSSSRDNTLTTNANGTLTASHACTNAVNDFAVNITCKKAPVVLEKKDDTAVPPVADNDVPLSPISRFILLQ